MSAVLCKNCNTPIERVERRDGHAYWMHTKVGDGIWCDYDPIAEPKEDACLCNVGVQECPMHPGRLLDAYGRMDFEKAWDAAYKAAQSKLTSPNEAVPNKEMP